MGSCVPFDWRGFGALQGETIVCFNRGTLRDLPRLVACRFTFFTLGGCYEEVCHYGSGSGFSNRLSRWSSWRMDSFNDMSMIIEGRLTFHFGRLL